MALWVCTARFGLTVLGFFGFMCFYMQRNAMSVAVVCMVNHTAVAVSSARAHGNDSDVLVSSARNVSAPSMNSTDATAPDGAAQCLLTAHADDREDGPFAFTKHQQGIILSAFYYGYVVSQVPGGMLAERYGGKWVFAIFTAIATLGTILSPVAARTHYGMLIAARVLVGIGSGGIYPVMHSIFGKWAPPNERSKLSSISYAGMPMGTVLIMPFAGVLCAHGFSEGWDSVFYVCGLISVVWLGLWVLLVGSTPASCRIITGAEREYISSSLKGQVDEGVRSKPIPWPKVFRSKAVWAIIIGMFTADWGFYTLMTNTPTYMYEVLRFDIQSSGWYSSLPFIANWLNMNVSAMIADRIITSGRMSIGNVRKLFTSIGMLGTGSLLAIVGFIPCTHAWLAVLCLTLGTGLWSSAYSGVFVSHIDIAPRYAGSLMGLANSVSSVGGFIAPTVAAALTKDGSRESWQIVFFIASAFFVVGNVVFLIFGSDKLEEWAVDDVMYGEVDEKQEMMDGSLKDKATVPVST